MPVHVKDKIVDGDVTEEGEEVRIFNCILSCRISESRPKGRKITSNTASAPGANFPQSGVI